MLNKKEIEMLQSFLTREDVKGKQWIEDFIWRNTVQAKFKVGDAVTFDARGQYHFGISPRNWTGTIVKIRYFAHWDNDVRAIQYEIEYQYQVEIEGKLTICKSKTYQLEKDISKASKVIVHTLQKKNEHQEYIVM